MNMILLNKSLVVSVSLVLGEGFSVVRLRWLYCRVGRRGGGRGGLRMSQQTVSVCTNSFRTLKDSSALPWL